ncbi:MAG: SGNH/GDSL hydrolase family protein [Candidatus Rokuibacteriota bacterium]
MRSRWSVIMLLAVLAVAALPAWADHATGKADLSRLVVVGDSLSAGFQNGSLHEALQPNGYASLVAARAGVALPLPLIAAPGIPNVLTLVDPGPPLVLGEAPGASFGRVDLMVQPMNLAVPGANVQDALTALPDLAFDDLTDLVLGLPGLLVGISRSQVEWAEALAPTTILLWLGSNDILDPALNDATDTGITPVDDFKSAYTEVMDRLAATGATLVVANIPDVTAVPFLTSAEDVAAILGLPLAVLGPILGIGPGDLVTPDAFDLIEQILLGSAIGPLPGSVVLDAGEVASIRSTTETFNAFIAAHAAAKGAAFVDIHGLLNEVQASGRVVGGQRLTTKFLGGLFSLDGVHPTNTGAALIANAFIRALNTHFAAGIPPVAVQQVAVEDPLVLAGVGHPPSAPSHPSPEAATAVRAGLRR